MMGYPVTPAYERAGFANEYAYRRARAQAREWSEGHSRSERSAYRSSMSPEQFRQYHDAFSSRATGITARRQSARKGEHLGPSRYVRKYLVENGYMDKSEFDDIYPRGGLR